MDMDDEHQQINLSKRIVTINLFSKPMKAGEDSSGSLEIMKRTRTNKSDQNTSRQKVTTATAILIVISHCKQHLLTEGNLKIECNIPLGYEQKMTRLKCNRLYKVQRTGIAVEIQVLLRRCSYPKQDVIRWYIRRGYRELSLEEPYSL